MTPRFTLLTAVYNASAYLRECIDSVLHQTCQEWQLICIDDCSTDSSMEILREYAERDPRIQVMQTSINSGQAVARNLGLKEAKGKFTLMLDADDLLSPDALESVWQKHLENPEADTFLFRLERFDDTGWHELEESPYQNTILSGVEACHLAIDWRIHGYFAINTDLHKRLPYDESLRAYGDDVSSRMHLWFSRQVVFCAGKYLYRQHGSSCTHYFSIRRIDFVCANSLLRCLLEQHGATADMLRCCEEYVWRNYIGVFRQMAAHAETLSQAERAQCDDVFREHLKRMQPSRLPWKLRWHFSYLFVRPYSLFKIYHTTLLALRQLVKRNHHSK